MNTTDEIITTAESALRHIAIAADDAHTDNAILSPTMIQFMAENALAKIQQLKQKQR